MTRTVHLNEKINRLICRFCNATNEPKNSSYEALSSTRTAHPNEKINRPICRSCNATNRKNRVMRRFSRLGPLTHSSTTNVVAVTADELRSFWMKRRPTKKIFFLKFKKRQNEPTRTETTHSHSLHYG